MIEQAGKVVGIEVGNLQVDLFSSAPGRGPVKLESVRAYLDSVQKRSSPAAGAKPAVQRLWLTPFRAHLAGAEDGPDLYDAVNQLMQQDLAMGSMQRVMLLADAGMGKSPALEYLRARAAECALDCLNSQANPGSASTPCAIPLLIRLGDLRAGQTLETLVRALPDYVVVPRKLFDPYVRPLSRVTASVARASAAVSALGRAA